MANRKGTTEVKAKVEKNKSNKGNLEGQTKAKVITQEVKPEAAAKKLTDESLGKVLLEQSYISADDLKAAENYTKSGRGKLTEFLLSNGILNKDLLGQAVAEYYKVPYADLNTNTPKRDQVLKIPESLAMQYRAVLYREDAKTAVITTDALVEMPPLSGFQPLFPGKKVVLAYSISDDIDFVLGYYKKSLETQFSKIIENQARIAPELLEVIFKDALAQKASDIHFEPNEKDVLVRFRVDGLLYAAGHLPVKFYQNILNRVKVLSNMRIDEHYAAQDGAIRFFDDNHEKVDMRVSVSPTIEGEKIVIRLLSHYIQNFSLADLGLSDAHREMVAKAAAKPFGMILVTGPTGSGKTTTLYSLLKLLNSSDVNITTIEDPVEYRLAGVNQIQVNAATNLTFAKGLRSIVRQDPDIILVGEVRDTETAEISVNAALTGHLLLSTFHANDAASAIPRLLDMGVEPFLISSTLEIIVAQRLVRHICDNCRVSMIMTKKQVEDKFTGASKYFTEEQNTVYEGKGCHLCNNTGYRGRTAIFEVITITPEMEELIVKSPSTKEIWDLAKKQGASSVFEDGILKIREGITTIDELLRVAEPPVEQVVS